MVDAVPPDADEVDLIRIMPLRLRDGRRVVVVEVVDRRPWELGKRNLLLFYSSHSRMQLRILSNNSNRHREAHHLRAQLGWRALQCLISSRRIRSILNSSSNNSNSKL